MPGQYHGFFWFYFINEHLLRFLNLRYPRDYNTVPKIWFWALNLVWMFPWSFYLPGVTKLEYNTRTRAGRTQLAAICWIAIVMLFFTFSTTQEYYSMPIYPALALLIGSSLSEASSGTRPATNVLAFLTLFLSLFLAGILVMVRHFPASGDIAQALNQNPEMYTLSLGHMKDLTLPAFAYLKLPIFIAASTFAICATGLLVLRRSTEKTALVLAVSMIFFFQASRVALVRFDSYLGSYPLAQELQHHPPGQLIETNAYYAFSSVFFYTNRNTLLLNGRINNLEYGSNAPGAPDVFIDDQRFSELWKKPNLCYLLAYGSEVQHLSAIVGQDRLHVVAVNSGNYLFSNHEIDEPR